MPSPRIFVIVPVFNEAAVIGNTLAELLQYHFRIIVVDDGSTDGTKEIIEKYPVIFLQHSLNLGQGAALQTGMEAAKKLDADIVVHFDADGQHNAAEVNSLLAPLLQNDCDVVFGSRFLRKEGKYQTPFNKRIVLQAGRYLNKLLTGILLTDAHNGLRAMNRTALEKIVIKETRMAHASEILALVQKNKLRYKEVPVTIQYTAYAKSKGQSIWNSVNILFDMVFKKMR